MAGVPDPPGRVPSPEVLPRRPGSDDARDHRRRLASDDATGCSGAASSRRLRVHGREPRRAVRVEHAADGARLIRPLRPLEGARRRPGRPGGEVAAGRRAPQADAVGIQLECRGVLAQISDRRLHVLDIAREDASGREAVVDRDHRVSVARKEAPEVRAGRSGARAPPATVDEDDDWQAFRRCRRPIQIEEEIGALGRRVPQRLHPHLTRRGLRDGSST